MTVEEVAEKVLAYLKHEGFIGNDRAK